MLLSSEFAFFLTTLASLGVVLIAASLGRSWVHISVCALLLISSFTAGKLITVFGFTASAATPIYAGIFLATDVLSEIYGPKEARLAIWHGFFANMCVILFGQLILASPAVPGDAIAQGLQPVLGFVPQLVFAGALAYIIAQHIDVWLFEKLKSLTGGRYLLIRNNGSTIVSQLIDSIIVYSIAFYGSGIVLNLILVAWAMKVFVALIDTPFMYAARAFSRRMSRDASSPPSA
jgi:hypothetical protein